MQAGVSLAAVESGLGCVVDRIDALPDTSIVIAAITTLGASLGGLRTGVAALATSVNGVIAARTGVVNSLGVLRGTVVDLGTSLAAVNSSLAGVDAALTPLLATQTTLLNPPSSLLPSLSAAVASLVPGAAGGAPATANILAATGPTDSSTTGTATLNRLLDTVPAAATSEFGPLATKLTALQSTISTNMGSVNYNAAADNVLALLALASTVQNVQVPALAAALDAAEASLAAVPRSGRILPNVTALNASVVSAQSSFNPVLANITAVNGTLIAFPGFAGLRNTLDQVTAIEGVVPCASALVSQVKAVEANLIDLPASLDDALALATNLNQTVRDALGQLDSVRDTIADAEARFASINLATYRDAAANAAASLRSAVASLDFSSVTSRILSLDSALAVNFTAMRASLAALNASLANPGVNASTADALRALQSLTSDTLALLPGVISDLNAGTFTCSVTTSSVCAFDAQCPSGETCPGNGTAAGLLRVDLWALAAVTGSQFDAAGIGASLTSLTAAASSIDGASLRSSIASAQSSLTTVSTSSIVSQVDALQASALSYDTSPVTQALADVSNALASVDTAAYIAQVQSFDSATVEIRVNVRNQVADAHLVLQAVRGQLDHALAGYAAALSVPSLRAIAASQGFGAVFQRIADVAQGPIDALWGVPQSLVTLPNKPGINTSSLLDVDVINRATATGPLYAQNRRLGVLHWLLSSLPISAANSKVVPATNLAAKRLRVDAAGSKYSGDRLCVQDSCIAAEADYVSVATIPDVVASFDVTLSSGVQQGLNLSIVSLVNLVWLFPAVVLALGLWALLGRWACCCAEARRPRWEKAGYGCMTGCIMCQLPICFVIAGLLFPLVMVTGDVCASGRNIAASIVADLTSSTAATAGLCALAPSSGSGSSIAVSTGALQPGVCAVSARADLPSGAALQIAGSINIPASLSAVLGNGAGASTSCTVNAAGLSSSPWDGLVASAVSAIRTAPYGELMHFIGPGSSLPARPALLAVAATATNATANVIADAVAGFASDVFSCGTLSTAVQASSDAVCCHMVTPLYWFASCLFLIAWGYCCCGLPAGILGRKRLVSRPWGAQADPIEVAEKAGRARARGRNGVPASSGGGASVDADKDLPPALMTSPIGSSSSGGRGGPGIVAVVDSSNVVLSPSGASSSGPMYAASPSMRLAGAGAAPGPGSPAARGGFPAASAPAAASFAPMAVPGGAASSAAVMAFPLPPGIAPGSPQAAAFYAAASAAAAGNVGAANSPSSRKLAFGSGIDLYRKPRDAILRTGSTAGHAGRSTTGRDFDGVGSAPPQPSPATAAAIAAAANAAAVVDSIRSPSSSVAAGGAGAATGVYPSVPSPSSPGGAGGMLDIDGATFNTNKAPRDDRRITTFA